MPRTVVAQTFAKVVEAAKAAEAAQAEAGAPAATDAAAEGGGETILPS